MTPLSEDRRERAFCGVGVRITGWLFSLSPLLALSMSCARCPTPFAQQHLKLLYERHFEPTPPTSWGPPRRSVVCPREVDRTPPPVGRSLGGGRCVTTDPSLGPCPCREPPQRSPPLLLSEPNRHRLRNRRFSLCKLVTQRRRLEPARLTYVYVEHPRGVGRPDCACRRSVQSLAALQFYTVRAHHPFR